jgi:hypothetical protein
VVVTTVAEPPQALVSIATPDHGTLLATGDTLRLQALVTILEPSLQIDELIFLWVVADLDLTDPAVRRSLQGAPGLAVAPNTLQPGHTYTFHVRLSLANEIINQASIDIQIASPPVAGAFAVMPAEGYALQTEFVLRCAGWADPLQPLEYRFGYKWATNQTVWLDGYSFDEAFTSHLPYVYVGQQVKALVVVVSVRNARGAVRQATAEVWNFHGTFTIHFVVLFFFWFF